MNLFTRRPRDCIDGYYSDDYWQEGEIVNVVFTRTKDLYVRGAIVFPEMPTWRITKVARKYLWVTPDPFPANIRHGAEDQYVKATGRLNAQNGFLSIVKPGTAPLILPEDSLPPVCCRCKQRHDRESR